MPCFFVFFCSCELRGIDIQLSVQHLMNCGTAGTCKGWSSKFFTGLLRGGGVPRGGVSLRSLGFQIHVLFSHLFGEDFDEHIFQMA